MQRQALNVSACACSGATVVPVTAGDADAKDATTEAIRDWVTTVNDSHYIIGSVVDRPRIRAWYVSSSP